MCYIRYFEARNDLGKSNFLVFKSFGMKIGDSCKYPFCPNSHKRNLLQILAFISNGISLSVSYFVVGIFHEECVEGNKVVEVD